MFARDRVLQMTWVSLATTAVWVAGFWVLSRDRSDTWQVAAIGAVASFIAVGLAAQQIWPQFRSGYPGDSYWTLDWLGRLGVVAISALGIALIFVILTLKTKLILRIKHQATNTAWTLIDLALGWAFYAVVFSTSPQAFYSFYRLIIPGLPQQWVIDGPLNEERLKVIAQLQPDGSLADHLAGITFWAIVPFTLWLHLRHWWRGGDGAR